MLRLQASAGNAAVARFLNPVQRKGDAGSCPAPPPTPAPAAPHADPKFAKIEKDVKGKAKDLKKHPPAAEEAKKAQDAAQPPGDDRASQAKAAQADTMAAAKPKGFDKAAFVAAVKQAIAAAAPKNLDEADKFANSSKPGEIKAAVASKVAKGKDDSGKEVAEKTKQAPDPSVAKEKPVVPLKEEPPPPPAAVDGANAMPEKAPKEQTDLRAGPCEVDAKMQDAEVTEDHLAKSNEAPMQEAAKAKKEAEVHAAEAPGEIRQKEAAAQQSAQSGAGAEAKTAMNAMVGSKGKLGGNVAAKKAAAKAKDEADRARISREINAIFDRTKTETEAKLTGLDAKVATEFDAGEAKAKAAFTAKHKADMDKYKDERYSGPAGWAQWTADLFTGLPPEANQIFDRAKAQYESEMTGVISRIADMIGKELEDAKARIEKGRQEIKAYVDSQPKELQKLAGETAKGVGDQFNQLESDVDAKQESLVNDLAQKYVEARNKVDEEIKAEQDKNKGLVDKAKEAVGGAIDAILKLKDLFMGLLAKAASAFTKILDDPLGFIGNFMNAIKSGFMNFANNILDHLKKGLMGWLLGALANAGIEIPDSFDLKGILKLVASILGLTWTNIKSRIVKIAPWIGKAIDVIESKVEVFVVLATKGVAGVWEWIKDKVGDLKDMVLGPIKEFVVEKIVKAGISWVLGMLNPAGALIKIVQALIGVVQWIMERGAALGEFISTVIDAVSSIAHGGVGGVPAKIEGALAKAVPLVISFLANLLGLGGISEKIKSVLETVQKPVGKAIDGLIKAGLKAAGPLVRGLQKGAAWVKGKYEKGKAFVKGKVAAVAEALGIIKKPLSVGGEQHTLSIDARTGRIRMASAEESLEAKVRRWVDTAKSRKVPGAEERGSHLLAAARSVTDRVRTASQGKGELARQQLDHLAGLVSDLVIKIGAKDQQKASERPDGLGNIAPHGSQPSSQRDKEPERHLESEHVIPVSFLSLLLNKIGDVVRIKRGGAEDKRLHTIMIYRSAAHSKTYGNEGADNLLINQLKALAARGTTTDLQGGSRRARRMQETHNAEALAAMQARQAENSASLMAGLRAKLPAILSARVNTTVRAVVNDHKDVNKKQIRGHDEPLPTEDRIRAAASAEAVDIADIVIDRLST